MHFKKLIASTIFCFLAYLVMAQEQQEKSNSFVYLSWANDLFVQTDYYFSNGLDLGYIRTAKNPVFLKQFNLNSFDHFSVVQDFFTPTNLDTEVILPEDRPYAAYLYVSYQKHLFATDQNLYFNPEILGGIIGPAALGRHLQTFTHEISPPSKPPQGWNNQVQNDLALNLNLSVEKGLVQKKQVLFNVFSDLRLGTLYSDLSIGARFRIGKYNSFFQSFKNLSFDTPKKWQLYFEVKPSIKLVGYNATLQGGVFNDTSPYVIDSEDVSRLVGVVDLSMNFSYKRFYFNGGLSWNSKEFVHATNHQWITIGFGWSF